MTNMVKIALRFGSDLAVRLSQTAGVARATLRIWRLKHGQSWPEDEMQDAHVLVYSS